MVAITHYNDYNARMWSEIMDTDNKLFESHQMMILFFGVDVLSSLSNAFILLTIANVSLLQEFCRLMKRYWHLIAIKFAYRMVLMFTTKDINLGMDSTGELNWITKDGRIKLINDSTDLSHEDKSLLLNQNLS